MIYALPFVADSQKLIEWKPGNLIRRRYAFVERPLIKVDTHDPKYE